MTGIYKIVVTEGSGATPWPAVAEELEKRVNDLMLEGWQPYFGLVMLGGRLAQAMLWEPRDEDGV